MASPTAHTGTRTYLQVRRRVVRLLHNVARVIQLDADLVVQELHQLLVACGVEAAPRVSHSMSSMAADGAAHEPSQ